MDGFSSQGMDMSPETNSRAVVLYSGGLDSILACEVLRRMGVSVQPLKFESVFLAGDGAAANVDQQVSHHRRESAVSQDGPGASVRQQRPDHAILLSSIAPRLAGRLTDVL